MIRASIALLHTLLGASSTTGGAWLAGQAMANARWEETFYGRTSVETGALLFGGLLAASVGVSQVAAAWGWFLGSRASGYTLVVVSALLALNAPLSLVALLGATSTLVLLDLMVQAQRAADAAP